MKSYFVYILQCADNSYCTGFTSDIQVRLVQHESGFFPDCYTFPRPLTLVFHQEFNDVDAAILFEKKIKGWSRKKKEALINGKLNELPALSDCRNYSHFSNKGFDSAQPDTLK